MSALTSHQIKQMRYSIERASYSGAPDIRIALDDLEALVAHAELTMGPEPLTEAQLQAAGIPTANSTEPV